MQRPLTDLDLVLVSQRITSVANLQRVAAHLEVPQHKVRAILYDHRFSINDAASAMLGAFRVTVGTAEEAFVLLEEALWKSGLGDLATDVLGQSHQE